MATTLFSRVLLIWSIFWRIAKFFMQNKPYHGIAELKFSKMSSSEQCGLRHIASVTLSKVSGVRALCWGLYDFFSFRCEDYSLNVKLCHDWEHSHFNRSRFGGETHPFVTSENSRTSLYAKSGFLTSTAPRYRWQWSTMNQCVLLKFSLSNFKALTTHGSCSYRIFFLSLYIAIVNKIIESTTGWLLN